MKTKSLAILIFCLNQVFGQEINQPFGLTVNSLMSPTFVDIDGDGDFDAFGVGTYGKSSQIFYQQNTGTKTSPTFSQPQYKAMGLTSKSLSSLTFVDIDGDGDLDAFGVGTYGKANQIFYQENTGTKTSPTFSKSQYKTMGLTTKSLSSPTFADIDGDGDLDAFGVGTYGNAGQIFYQQNTGTNTSPIFSEPQYKAIGLTSNSLSSPTFADIDGDGDFDAFGVGTNEKACQIFYHQNTGTKTSPAFSEPQYKVMALTSNSISSPTFADIDGDGDLDAFGVGTYAKAGQVFVILKVK